MVEGYAFEADPDEYGDDYFAIANDAWETVCYSLDGAERYLGNVNIDGARCAVFECSDRLYRAQLAHMTAE
jgi:hypothetical protein